MKGGKRGSAAAKPMVRCTMRAVAGSNVPIAIPALLRRVLVSSCRYKSESLSWVDPTQNTLFILRKTLYLDVLLKSSAVSECAECLVRSRDGLSKFKQKTWLKVQG